jgi:acetyl esterase
LPTRAPVDPELSQLIAEAVVRLASDAGASVEQLRASAIASGEWSRGSSDSALALVVSRDGSVDGVRVRWFGPELTADGDVIVYFHGGGWMVGDVDSYDPDARLLAHRTGSTVVSVDYRRAPEHPFPAPLDDCVAVIRHLGSLPHRSLAVAGDSAGGNLALGSAVALAGEDLVDAVLALYPVIDPGAMGNNSYTANGSDYLLTTEAMTAFWGVYAPGPDARRDPRANLALADPVGFPATVVATADYDPLRDEAREFCARLVAADVDATYIPHPGLTHGFQQMVPRIPAATRALDAIYDAFTLTFARAAARRTAAARMARL